MIVILTPRISPARLLYYKELGRNRDLTVISDVVSKHVNEKTNLNFSYYKLKSLVIGQYMGISYEVIKYLFKFRKNIFIIEQYSSPNAIVAIVLFRIFRKKFILNADGGFVNPQENILKKLIKSFLLSSSYLVLSSGENCDYYLNYYGVEKKNIRRSYLSSFSEVTVSYNSKKLNLNVKSIAVVGQLIFRKGVDLILSLAEHLGSSFQICLVGGNYQDLEWTNKLIPSNVQVIDFMSRDSMFNLLDKTDLIIIPTREDIWNYTLFEAYSRGKRVISSDKAGASLDYIYRPDLFMFKSEDIDDLSRKVLQSFTIELSDEEKDYYFYMAKQFNIENMSRNTIAVIEEFINEEC